MLQIKASFGCMQWATKVESPERLCVSARVLAFVFRSMCVYLRAWHMQVCALAYIHVCIEGITYTARLMWKSCSQPGFYILFITSWHNVSNRHQCSVLASACSRPRPSWMTGGGWSFQESEMLVAKCLFATCCSLLAHRLQTQCTSRVCALPCSFRRTLS